MPFLDFLLCPFMMHFVHISHSYRDSNSSTTDDVTKQNALHTKQKDAIINGEKHYVCLLSLSWLAVLVLVLGFVHGLLVEALSRCIVTVAHPIHTCHSKIKSLVEGCSWQNCYNQSIESELCKKKTDFYSRLREPVHVFFTFFPCQFQVTHIAAAGLEHTGESSRRVGWHFAYQRRLRWIHFSSFIIILFIFCCYSRVVVTHYDYIRHFRSNWME